MLLLAIAVLPALPTPPPPTCVMVSRGQGGCGGYPYMVDGLTGTADDAISYCLANPACIKVQWDSSGNIYPSDSNSGVQATEPNGGSWSCRFKECSPNISSIWESNGKMTCREGDYFTDCSGPKAAEDGMVCAKAGCYKCPKGSHLCERDRGYYFSSCPNGKKCDSKGCIDGSDPENPRQC